MSAEADENEESEEQKQDENEKQGIQTKKFDRKTSKMSVINNSNQREENKCKQQVDFLKDMALWPLHMSDKIINYFLINEAYGYLMQLSEIYYFDKFIQGQGKNQVQKYLK